MMYVYPPLSPLLDICRARIGTIPGAALNIIIKAIGVAVIIIGIYAQPDGIQD